MKLLDLPQELFDEVITHCVTDNGVAASWKIRSTCSKYRPSSCLWMSQGALSLPARLCVAALSST
jgi:hypothetical protein